MSVFGSLTLRTKLLTGFMICSLLTLVVGLYGVNRLDKLDDASEFLYQKATLPLGSIGDIASSFQRIRVNMAVLVGTDDKKTQKEMLEGIKKLRENIGKEIVALEKGLTSDEEKSSLAKLTATRLSYIEIQEKIFNMVASDMRNEAYELLQGDGRKAANEYRIIIEEMVKSFEEKARLVDEANGVLAHQSEYILYGAIAFAVLSAIGLGVLITRGVSAQLGEDPGYLSDVAGRIAGGDLDVAFRAQQKRGGVYAVMQDMVQTMKAKIAEAEHKSAEASEQARLAGIATDAANQAKAAAERAKAEGMMAAAMQLEKVVEIVSSASEQLSAQVEQSSRGTEAQSARVGETATAMEEMNSTVLEVARNASHAAESTDAARKKAAEGAQIVSKVVEGIGEMQRVSATLKTDMDALGKQAESIGQIMNVISDIADQTNLLALNAAIEAARAGDAGRGFAVVADEVRKLAEKTMTATKEVGEAIHGIQQGSRKNLENVDHSARAVDSATSLAQKSGEALNEIVHMVDTATDQVRSIATASEEQAATSEEINRSIEDINRISSETASAMAQSAQAVVELANQVQSLRMLIGNMKSGG